MRDIELECLVNWRFVPIPYGEKGPKTKDWHKKPYTLEQIPQNSNIGVILGPQSNGIIAIDFDGPWAWDYWLENIKVPFDTIDTVMWTSNKPGRCQMAFQVPIEFWPHMPDCFKVIGPIGEDGKHQAIEFRWGNTKGIQSVLPPSLHPDNKIDPNVNYAWLRKPSQVNVQEIPIELLEWIYNYKEESDIMEQVTEYSKNTPDDVAQMCEELKRLYPSLDYDTWIRVTWAFCSELGTNDGIMLMKYYYPESKKGEYNKLTKSRYSGKRVTIATVVKMIKDRNGNLPKRAQAIDLIGNNKLVRNLI